jgi:meso-butanediol dehydrogenase / (S,S)-butanediol dehydrogenase / diacetyl reductase
MFSEGTWNRESLMKNTKENVRKEGASKVAVVTGGARGIGLAIARWFLAHGYRVAIWDIDDKTLKAARAELNTKDVLAVTCDISSPKQVQGAVRKVTKRFGRIDTLVNNAGVAIFKPLMEISWKDWRSIMNVNLDGAFLCSQACLPAMIAGGGGSIVNIASISGLRASTLRVAYGTSKAALIHLTRQQAAELGEVGIRVNCIAPGPVLTEMAKLVHSTSIIQDYFDAMPLARYGTPEEIAEGVGFLCSDAARFITGQTLAVDGGFDASGIGLPSLRVASGKPKDGKRNLD